MNITDNKTQTTDIDGYYGDDMSLDNDELDISFLDEED